MAPCKNCGSESATWTVSTRVSRHAAGVPDGRFKSNEILPIAYLGCDHCSETLRTIEAEDIEEILNAGKR